MDLTALKNQVINAAKASFGDLLNREERFYAFILYTDEDCYTIVPAANSIEGYERAIEHEEDKSPESLNESKWASAEWAYEAFAADGFSPICNQLSTWSSAVASDSVAFSDFKKKVHECMIGALQALDDEGFFGGNRKDIILYISSSDYDESIEIENCSAKILNPPDVYATFLNRYQVL